MSWTLVTGGGKGLGAEICRHLAEKGHSLIIHYNNSRQAAEIVRMECQKLGAHAVTLQGDFSTEKGMGRFASSCLKHYPEIKNLVNNVGNYAKGRALEQKIGEWELLFRSNLLTSVYFCQAFASSIQLLRGSILNLGVAGLGGRAETYSTAYSAAKLSLFHFTKALAKEMAPFGVSVNMLSPGYLENSVDLPDFSKNETVKRAGTLHEAARVAAFLLDEVNHYVTGQNLEVAGGQRL